MKQNHYYQTKSLVKKKRIKRHNNNNCRWDLIRQNHNNVMLSNLKQLLCNRVRCSNVSGRTGSESHHARTNRVISK